MSRPNSKLWFVIPALVLAVVASACGGGDEEVLFNKYFTASKVGDNMTLANIATVAFDPKTDGQMQSFSIVSVSEPVVTPLEIKKHAADLKAAADEEKTFSEKKKVFQDANGDAIDRILKAEQKNQTLKGKDAELQKEWTKWREETAVYAKRVSEVRKKVAADQPLVEISCQDQRNPIDTTAYEGESASKDVTISGKVKTEAGVAAKKYLFTLQRITLHGVNGKDVVGRWVITTAEGRAVRRGQQQKTGVRSQKPRTAAITAQPVLLDSCLILASDAIPSALRLLEPRVLPQQPLHSHRHESHGHLHVVAVVLDPDDRARPELRVPDAHAEAQA